MSRPLTFISLFSGIEACSTAWEQLGWRCAAVAEIEPFPCAVLAHRFGASAPRHLPDGFARRDYRGLPDIARIPNLGDVSQVTDAEIAALGPIDFVIGGSPCQDLSVAGKRRGLAGARSGLFHQQLRIFHAARTFCGARFLGWENVPGAFSTHGGRDFALVVGEMAGLELAVPRDGWGNEGVALGPNGLVEWGVLDAQWFGVAQRRRRVFAVLDTGNWAGRRPLLLEPDRLRGDSAPRREPRQNAPAGARAGAPVGDGVIALGSGQAGAEVCTNGEAPALTCLHEAPIVAMPTADVIGCLNSSGGHAVPGNSVQDAVAHQLVPMVAHSLRGEGFDASEDGTGRGTPLVPVSVALRGREGGAAIEVGDDCAFALRASQGGGDKPHVLAFGCKDSDPAAGVGADVAPTLRAMPGERPNGGGQVAVAFQSATEFLPQSSRVYSEAEVAPTLQAAGLRDGNRAPQVQQAMAVRRLTPRECERLQGFPDDHTRIAWRGKEPAECPDGPRYKALGNSMAVPCMLWIGQQIARVVRESEVAA